jgi:hypothetical protein
VAKPFLFRILKGMEGPARLAGLGRMQSFLVAGFEAFRHMRGAEDFIRIIAARERATMNANFSEGPGPGHAARFDEIGYHRRFLATRLLMSGGTVRPSRRQSRKEN